MKLQLHNLFPILLFTVSLALTGCFEKKKEEVVETPSTDGGGTGDGDGETPAMTTQENYRIVFVTTTEVNGTGVASGTGSGLTSFDALCETEKVTKGFGGTFKAMIGVNQRYANGTDWILRAGKEYRREDLTTVIGYAEDDASHGIIIPAASSTSITAPGNNLLPWTGLTNNWAVDSMNCSDWSRNDNDNTGATMANYGKSSLDFGIDDEYVDLGYTQFWGSPFVYNQDPTKQFCDQKHPIYCVQTKQLPPPGDYKRLFMSTTGVRGDGGIPAMDSVCAADAVTNGLTGTYKAVVVGRENPSGGGTSVVRRVCESGACSGATAMEQSIDWVLYPNMNYRRADNVTFIGTTNVHGYFEDEFEEPIASGGQYWSGMTNSAALSATFQHCGGWSEPTFNGFVNNAGSATPDYGSASVLCSTSLSVLCAEQ